MQRSFFESWPVLAVVLLLDVPLCVCVPIARMNESHDDTGVSAKDEADVDDDDDEGCGPSQ